MRASRGGRKEGELMALRDWTTTRKHDGWHPPAEGYRQTGLGEPNQTQEEKMVKSEKKRYEGVFDANKTRGNHPRPKRSSASP